MTGRKVLAIASGGGHWKQLMQLRPAFVGCDVRYATTIPGLAEKSGINDAYIVPDANRNAKFKICLLILSVLWKVISLRPDVVITTGAAPGLIAIFFGRLVGAKTLWIDSVANAAELSMAGRLSKKFAHQTLSQWPEVADREFVGYAGSVL